MAYYPKTMEQHISQEEIRRIIISDMVKKRSSIVPVIGEDTIVRFFYVSLVLFSLSFIALKWSTIKEGSKAMPRYTLLRNIGSSAYEASLLAPQTYVQEAMNLCFNNWFNKIDCGLNSRISYYGKM